MALQQIPAALEAHVGPLLKHYSPQLSQYHKYVPVILQPAHQYVPFAALDLFGAMRLSSVVNWIATGVFDAPASPTENGTTGPDTTSSEKGKKKKPQAKTKARASLLQECFGILVVVFGGETFIAMLTGQLPSWLISPKIPLLFSIVHALQTRTSFIRFLPKKPSLALELVMAVPDAVGRALVLTQFSVVPLLQPPPNVLSPIPPTPASLILVPVILTVPFASIIFSATNFFSPKLTLQTPAELQPGGWKIMDAWIPFVTPALFLCLVGPVQGWDFGFGLAREPAIVVCIMFVVACFVSRAIYNFGHKREQWLAMVGMQPRKKIKTA